MALTLDDSGWPILVITTSASLSEEELQAFTDPYHAAIFKRSEPFVTIVDARSLRTVPSARARRIIGEARERALARGLESRGLGLVLVTTNAVVRGVATAIQWLAPGKLGWTTVETLDDARVWAKTRLAARR